MNYIKIEINQEFTNKEDVLNWLLTLEKIIKTDKEKEIEIMQTINETKQMLKIAISNFEYAEDDLIDYYTYQIKANQAKLDYLIKIAKRKGLVLNRVNELTTRLYKNNMAG